MGLNHQTKHKKALDKLDRIHEAMARELGPAHPITLRTFRDIGQVFYSKKDYEEALEVYRIVLYLQRNKVKVDEVDETTLEHHPNIINKISTNRPRRKSFSDAEIRICERNIRKKDSIKISRTNAELEILMGGATSNENTAAAGNKGN
ncbi:hypothetical protein CEXT_607351 [Caerostris extrusa]|uniref:Kinesin light chain n=1 Tax=Caerostris extrusa TaxID=172846 RepID=A0AAV4V9R8_CAEEX|nr:hypothetical protein CEXT_607351 [Caerostris extrusa]